MVRKKKYNTQLNRRSTLNNKIIVTMKRVSQGIWFYMICFVMLSALFISGCDRNPSEIDLKYGYSLYAYLIVGGTIDNDNPVSIKKPLDPYKPFKDQEIGIPDAVVRLYTTDEPRIDVNLVHSANGEYVLAAIDSLIIQPGTTYSIEIDINGHRIEAKTTTPNRTVFENRVMSRDSSDFPALDIETLRDNPLMISCPLGEERIVYLESYCLEEYHNARFVYNYFGSNYPKDQEQYESPTGGFPRRLVSVGVYSSRESIDPENIYVTDYDSMFFFYGKNRMTVFVIDRNYYEYIYKTNGWENAGVTGAYGVFGSGIGERFYLKIVD